MSEQLNLVGVTVPGLGPTQRAVLDELERLGNLSRDEAGAISHERRGKHSRDQRCAHCAMDGRIILASLVKRHLAERGAEGMFQLPHPGGRSEGLQGPGDLPEG